MSTSRPKHSGLGIKVVDLLAPYAKGGKIGLFGGAGVGKTVLIMELLTTLQAMAVTRYLPVVAGELVKGLYHEMVRSA